MAVEPAGERWWSPPVPHPPSALPNYPSLPVSDSAEPSEHRFIAPVVGPDDERRFTDSGIAVARLYQSGGRPRFTGITCDESRFKVGVRAPNENRGTPSLLVAGPDVWIFHPGEPSDDQFGNAAMGWWLPFSELWPSGG